MLIKTKVISVLLFIHTHEWQEFFLEILLEKSCTKLALKSTLSKFIFFSDLLQSLSQNHASITGFENQLWCKVSDKVWQRQPYRIFPILNAWHWRGQKHTLKHLRGSSNNGLLLEFLFPSYNYIVFWAHLLFKIKYVYIYIPSNTSKVSLYLFPFTSFISERQSTSLIYFTKPLKPLVHQALEGWWVN